MNRRHPEAEPKRRLGNTHNSVAPRSVPQRPTSDPLHLRSRDRPIHCRTVPMLYRWGYFVSISAISAFLESASYTFQKASVNRGSNPCRGANFQICSSGLPKSSSIPPCFGSHRTDRQVCRGTPRRSGSAGGHTRLGAERPPRNGIVLGPGDSDAKPSPCPAPHFPLCTSDKGGFTQQNNTSCACRFQAHFWIGICSAEPEAAAAAAAGGWPAPHARDAGRLGGSNPRSGWGTRLISSR